MVLPFFYIEETVIAGKQFFLNEETSKHVAQVLRMHNGEQVKLTDGKGNLFITEIIDNNKKKCLVKMLSNNFQPAPAKKITIAISLIKNTHRFEWFLEKATEIGASEIIPLLCTRTEKQHFRFDRMKSILISAMLQSQQAWLPVLHEPVKYAMCVKEKGATIKKYIAHCREDEPRTELSTQPAFNDTIILIGPEGDFTVDETELALQNDFMPVALGNTRLRTETAGVVAATLLLFA